MNKLPNHLKRIPNTSLPHLFFPVNLIQLNPPAWLAPVAAKLPRCLFGEKLPALPRFLGDYKTSRCSVGLEYLPTLWLKKNMISMKVKIPVPWSKMRFPDLTFGWSTQKKTLRTHSFTVNPFPKKFLDPKLKFYWLQQPKKGFFCFEGEHPLQIFPQHFSIGNFDHPKIEVSMAREDVGRKNTSYTSSWWYVRVIQHPKEDPWDRLGGVLNKPLIRRAVSREGWHP